MKQIFVYVFFLLISPVSSALIPDSGVNTPEGSLVLKASVTDVYDWSERHKRYSLKESLFSFKILEDRSGGESPDPAVSDDLELVDEGNITQTLQPGSARYLYVSRQNRVSLESANGRKVMIKSKLSKDRGALDIYFSQKRKLEILQSLLAEAEVEVSSPGESEQTASDYSCKLNETQQLICSINYVSPIQVASAPQSAKPTESL